MSEPSSQRHPRRWFRFSLRTLLLLVALLCVGLGLLVKRAKQQQAAIKEITAQGGWVYYDYQMADGDPTLTPTLDAPSWVPDWLLESLGPDYFHDVVFVNMVYNQDAPKRLDNKLFTDDVKAHLSAFPKLQYLLLANGQASDDLLKAVAGLRHLTRLYMWDAASVTDAGVAHLAGHSRLKHVHLSNSGITDESLRTFGTMAQIEKLALQGNRFSDEGLAHLRGLTQLQELAVDMGHSRITDDGLKHLEGLTSLRLLSIQRMPVTREGVARLKAALPGLYLGQ